MRMIDAPNDLEAGLCFRRVSENGLVEIGLWRVMYGIRVRAGFVREPAYLWDWCGGAEWKFVELLYSMGVSILEHRDEDRDCFLDVPGHSDYKPAFLDPVFMGSIMAAAEPFKMIHLDVRQLPAPEPLPWEL